MRTKYVFVTGGVVSGLGKGITAGSLGRLLKNRGYKVTIQKFDPYINIDPGTMSPYEHGEVFVTEDGAETDLDLGHYERFIDENLTKNSSITTGKIYQEVINKERIGGYLGKTVQVIPHITNAIKDKIYFYDEQDVDIVIIEIGGTVGDIESLPFLEAIRQFGIEREEDVVYIHVTLLPYVIGSNEVKSKPTQHSVKELQSIGIKPNILVCRTEEPISEEIKEKLALFCNVKKTSIIANQTASCLYEIPLLLEKEGLAKEVCQYLKLEHREGDHSYWEKMIQDIKSITQEEVVTIGIVGKYIKLEDSYLSVIESIRHGGFANHVHTKIKLIDAETLRKEKINEQLNELDGIIVPGGFGNRGIEGKLLAIEYARQNKIPFLGICLGMQMAVVEFARNVLLLPDANSEEFEENCLHPVIHIMKEQEGITKKGGTMRLGSYECHIKENSLAHSIYGKTLIQERHRHRFEFNNRYKEQIEEKGMICCGFSPNGQLVEMVEIPDHPFFIASQFHPEFKSRPDKPAPLFRELVKCAKNQKEKKVMS